MSNERGMVDREDGILSRCIPSSLSRGEPVNPQQARIYVLAVEFYACAVEWRYISIDRDSMLGAWLVVAW